MHAYNENFKFDSVKGEVVDAMQFDWKRDKIDDAKKRAIYDCKNYDDFKERVAGCTLKPIHRDEFNAIPKFNFNRTGGLACGLDEYARKPEEASGYGSAGCLAPTRGVGTLPKNLRQFEREIRRRPSAEERVELLEALDSTTLTAVFGRECDAELLRQCLVALDEAGVSGVKPPRAARRFISLLVAHCSATIVSSCAFFGNDERELIARLLAREADTAEKGEDVRVCAAMNVQPSAVARAATALAGCGPAPWSTATARNEAEATSSSRGNAATTLKADAASHGAGASSSPIAVKPQQPQGSDCDEMD